MLRGFALVLLAGLPALAQRFNVTSYTLANGMKILVQEDHSIPNVALHFFFRVGSRNERPGITGISHFFEHMMFNGARKYGRGQFDNVMLRNGGDNNAYTSADLTVYTDWFPRESLGVVMEMEADRIRDLNFDPAAVESERGVVSSERRSSVDNSNFGLLYEQLYATAFTAHPYRWPIIGWASDIQAWTIDDLKAHYRRGYAPNNCVVVAVGDVGREELAAAARKYLEPIPRGDPPPPVEAREPAQTAERRTVVRRAVQSPLELVGYHVPASNHPDYWPLRSLTAVLASGQSSRLYRRLVDRDQLALSESGWLQPSLDPGLLIFTLHPRGAAELEDAEHGLFQELDNLRETGPSPGEIEKARNQLLASHYLRLRTNSGRATLLGEYEIYFGDFRKLFSVPDAIGRVTAADVKRVARLYLREENRTVARLLPEAPALPEPSE